MNLSVHSTRRRFLQASLLGCVAGVASPASAAQKKTKPDGNPQAQRVTLAQVKTTSDIAYNLSQAERTFRQAKKDRAGWVFFPELFLTGTYNGNRFKQAKVAPAFKRIANWCRVYGVVGVIGTGWQEDEKLYNQLRIVDAEGKTVGVYAKTCLTYGDAKEFSPGPMAMTHDVGGIRIGTLICNDLWVTPGYSDGPNPHLSLKIAKAGAQVIFHSVGSGSDERFLAYHDSNVITRAAEAKCPIVVVNGFRPPVSNVTSGVAGTDYRHSASLPRDEEVIKTVEFTPARRRESVSRASTPK